MHLKRWLLATAVAGLGMLAMAGPAAALPSVSYWNAPGLGTSTGATAANTCPDPVVSKPDPGPKYSPPPGNFDASGGGVNDGLGGYAQSQNVGGTPPVQRSSYNDGNPDSLTGGQRGVTDASFAATSYANSSYNTGLYGSNSTSNNGTQALLGSSVSGSGAYAGTGMTSGVKASYSYDTSAPLSGANNASGQAAGGCAKAVTGP